MIKYLYGLLSDFFTLLFPFKCFSCSDILVKGEEVLCLKCYSDLPLTRYESKPDNPVAQIFWGRVPVESAMSLCFFEKGNKAQALIHSLKYAGKPVIGAYLGKLTGNCLLASGYFSDLDYIVPVPLHPLKKKVRGYNQSEAIAGGISKITGAEVVCGNLYRKENTESQTKKSRFNRWVNVDSAFGLHDPGMFAGKHILLVDDVVTTGSTIEACCNALLKAEGVRISIATAACAE